MYRAIFFFRFFASFTAAVANVSGLRKRRGEMLSGTNIYGLRWQNWDQFDISCEADVDRRASAASVLDIFHFHYPYSIAAFSSMCVTKRG